MDLIPPCMGIGNTTVDVQIFEGIKMYNYLIYKTYDELKKAKSNGTKLSTEQEMFIKNMEKQHVKR